MNLEALKHHSHGALHTCNIVPVQFTFNATLLSPPINPSNAAVILYHALLLSTPTTALLHFLLLFLPLLLYYNHC